MEDSLKKRYVIKLLANFITGIVNIILIAIVPKALGPVAFGQFSYIQQFFSQIISFLDAGTSTAFFTKLAANHTRKELILFYSFFSLSLLFVLYIFVFSIDILNYSIYFLPDIPIEYIYLGLYFGFFTWLTQVYIKISDSYALTVSVELIKIIHKLLSLVLLYIFIHYLSFDLILYFYFHYISLISFLFIISILFIKKDIFNRQVLTLKLKYKELIQEFYDYASPLFIFNIVSIFIALFDIWLLQKVSGSIQTGYYGLAYSITAMCFLFTSAMTPIISREFSKSFAIEDRENIKVLFKRYIPMLYAIAAYFGIFIAFQSENLLSIFTDEKFKDVYYVLIIMAFYPIHQTYGQLSGSLFFSMNETRLYRNIGIVSSLIGLLFTYIYIYLLEYGAVGFAWKMVLVQIIGVNIQLYFNSKHLKISIIPFLIHQVVSILFFIIIAYVSTQFMYPDQNGIKVFLINGIVYTILVIFGIILFPYIFSVSRKELNSTLANIKNKIMRI